MSDSSPFLTPSVQVGGSTPLEPDEVEEDVSPELLDDVTPEEPELPEDDAVLAPDPPDDDASGSSPELHAANTKRVTATSDRERRRRKAEGIMLLQRYPTRQRLRQ